jgi:L-lactate dehydrogenase complex protein LldF
MEIKTGEFKKAAAAAVADDRIQANLKGLYEGFHQARQRAAAATPNWDEISAQGRKIKAHTIEHLDHYLEMAEDSVTRAGGKVFFARDADAANRYVLDLAAARGVEMVIKGKSMLSEEMGLNHRLEAAGIEAVETDLGEFLIQLREETPYHIIAPAVHMSKEDVATVLHDKMGTPRYERAEEMTAAARELLREKFIQADMGVTGANFLVAETGTLVLVTNEGNGRMCTSMPRVHVALMGMEKLVPSMEDLGVLLRLLIRSATGQRLSSYVTTVTGPRHRDEVDGPEEFHLIIVDNGRSKLLADPNLREVLYCLRCGACLNACPVYRKVGGHAYGWVYSGPIGAVVSPVLTDLPGAKDLPYASTLCGACREACPVDINIPRMLLHLRSELAEGKTIPDAKSVSTAERLAMKAWRLSVAGPRMLAMANRLARLAQWPLLRGGRLTRLPPPLSGWTRHRTFPAISSMPFSARWRKYLGGGRRSDE